MKKQEKQCLGDTELKTRVYEIKCSDNMLPVMINSGRIDTVLL